MCFGMISVFSAALRYVVRLRPAPATSVQGVPRRPWASIGHIIGQDTVNL